MNSTNDSSQIYASPLTIWAMTSGAPGMRSQVIGLANAVRDQKDDQIIEKTVQLKKWAHFFPGHLNPAPFMSLTSSSCPLSPPWPDILLTSGRRTSAASIAIGRASKGQTYRVHIQNPQTPTRFFDLVCSMAHDGLRGENVIETTTALHKITCQDLEKDAPLWHKRWRNQLERPGRGPLLGIILGGKTKKYGFSQQRLRDLIHLIETAVGQNNAQILITPSSRTEAFVKQGLATKFENHPDVWFWDQTGDNPYFAILNFADHIMVTADSVSMISEALYTPKPVHIYALEGTSRRHQIFLSLLSDQKVIHTVQNELDFSVDGTRAPIDETTRIAHIIRQKYQQHRARHADIKI